MLFFQEKFFGLFEKRRISQYNDIKGKYSENDELKDCHSRPCLRRGKLVPAKAGSGNPESKTMDSASSAE